MSFAFQLHQVWLETYPQFTIFGDKPQTEKFINNDLFRTKRELIKMAKVLLLWDIRNRRADPGEKTMLLDMVKEDIESGKLTDWGAFSGELKGYAIVEGSDQEVGEWKGRYDTYIRFSTQKSVISVNEVSLGGAGAQPQALTVAGGHIWW
jgi:hypothetical protein